MNKITRTAQVREVAGTDKTGHLTKQSTTEPLKSFADKWDGPLEGSWSLASCLMLRIKSGWTTSTAQCGPRIYHFGKIPPDSHSPDRRTNLQFRARCRIGRILIAAHRIDLIRDSRPILRAITLLTIRPKLAVKQGSHNIP